MSRFIDAEWLKGEIRKAFPSFYMRVEINTLVNLAPSIDIVRCRECKYWVSDGGALMLCDIHKDPTVPEHFCSYGCREEREGE